MKIKKVKPAKIKEIKKDVKVTERSHSLEQEVKEQDEADSNLFQTSGFRAPVLEQTSMQESVQSNIRTSEATEIEKPFVAYRSPISIQEAAIKYEVSSVQIQKSAVMRPQVIDHQNNNVFFNADPRLSHQDSETKYYEGVKLDDVKVKRRGPWDG